MDITLTSNYCAATANTTLPSEMNVNTVSGEVKTVEELNEQNFSGTVSEARRKPIFGRHIREAIDILRK